MANYEERIESLYNLINDTYKKELERVYKLNGLEVKEEYTEDEYYLKTAIDECKYDEVVDLVRDVTADLDVLEIFYIASKHSDSDKIRGLAIRNMEDAVEDINRNLVFFDYIKFDIEIMDFRNYTEEEIKEFKTGLKKEAERQEELDRISKELMEKDEIPF